MKRMNVLMAAFSILLLILAASPALGHGEEEGTQVAEGRLVAVNPDLQTLTVETTEGEMTFTYNAETEISGAEGGVEGLAGSEGTNVRVHFRSEDLVAEKIEVIA